MSGKRDQPVEPAEALPRPEGIADKTLEQLSQDAVRHYQEALFDGHYYLPGRTIELSPQDMTKIIQDLTRRTAKKFKTSGKLEDYELPTTRKESK